MRFTDPIRDRLSELIARDRKSMSETSVAIGRNVAWVQQFLQRGTPKQLPERDRRALAELFNIDERELGAIEPWRPR